MSARPYLIDGRPLQSRSAVRGIGTYLRGLLEGMATLGTAPQIALMLQKGYAKPEELKQYGYGSGPTIRVTKRRLQPLLDPLLVAGALRSWQPRLYHAIDYGQPWRAPCPVIVTVHDMIPFLFPDDAPWMRRERLLPMRLFRHAEIVLTNSQCTAGDVARIAMVDPQRIVVTPLGVGMHFKPAGAERISALREKLNIHKPFIFFVGTFDRRKRLEILLEVFSELRAQQDLQLVITGNQGDYAPRVAKTIASFDFKARTKTEAASDVICLGHVAEVDLITLYSAAEVFVFPSAYEGFGLPLLESMACGTPVVSFANSAIGEVVGDIGLLVRDGDVQYMAHQINILLTDSAERKRRSEEGKAWAAHFTWEKTAALTLEAYRRLVVDS